VPGVRGEGVKKKRWTLKIALYLLAGAVVTWGVAWGCALWGGKWASAMTETDGWPPEAPREWPAPGLETTGHGFGRRERSWQRAGMILHPTGRNDGSYYIENIPANEFYLAHRLNTGWPRLAMTRLWLVSSGSGVHSSTTGLAANVPTRILPLGFTLNTLFYAAALLGVAEGVAFARRRVRRGRGRCPSCGYDRAGLAEGSACPECGG
jgi:hypothetical protein